MKLRQFFSIFIKSANSFEGQEFDEKVVLLLRRHPFVILIKLILFAFLILIPIFLNGKFFSFLYSNNLLNAFHFMTSVYYLLIWTAIFYSLTMYTLDVWIVTNRRIIDSTQRGLFNRVVSELHLSRIQDISVSTRGVIQTILKFGDLQVQTAGADEKFKFLQIPNPEKVKNIIGNISHSKIE